MAVPTPPPTMATVPKRSTSEGWPRGPTTSRRASPASRRFRSLVVLPIPWTIRVMVPPARDGAGDGQRDALALLMEADDDELSSLALAGDARGLDTEELDFRGKEMGFDDLEHGRSASSWTDRG